MEWVTANAAAEVIGILYNSEVSVVGKIPCKILELLEDKSRKCEERERLINRISSNMYSISDEAKEIITFIRKKYLSIE